MNDAPVRVAIYTRVSTDIQANREEGSLDTQEARIRSSIAARFGAHEIVQVFREEGASGKNLDRPAMQRLLKAVKKGKVDLVMVTRIDRLSRSLLDFFEVYQLFEKHQVKFTSLREQFDTSSPVGRAMLKLMLVFAELEREQTAERTRIAMRARAERGLWNGGPPMLGYDSAGSGRIVVNEEEAVLVRLIFDKYIELRSSVKLMHWLNENGYRQKRWTNRDGAISGGKTWVTANIRTLLRHKVYLGLVTHSGEAFAGQHEPIVELETWEKVQRILDDNIQRKSTPKPNANYPFPFVHLVRCACGYAMTSTSAGGRKGRYFYYACVGHQKARDHVCDVKRVRAEALDEAAMGAIRAAMSDPAILNAAVEEATVVNEGLLEPLRDRIRGLRTELAAVSKEGETLLMALVSGGLMDNEFARAKLDEVTRRRRELEESLQQGEAELEAREGEFASTESIRNALQVFQSWEHLTGGERRELLRNAISEVRVFEGKLEIDFFDASVMGGPIPKVRRSRKGGKQNPSADVSGWGMRSSEIVSLPESSRVDWMLAIWPFTGCESRRRGSHSKAPRQPRQSILARAKELEALRAKHGWSRSRLAGHLGVSRSAVTQALRPLDAPPRIRAELELREERGEPVGRRELAAAMRLPIDRAVMRLQRTRENRT
jgi:site-specific DNA recombinase